MDKFNSTAFQPYAPATTAIFVLEAPPAIHILDTTGAYDDEGILIEVFFNLTSKFLRLTVRQFSLHFDANRLIDHYGPGPATLPLHYAVLACT